MRFLLLISFLSIALSGSAQTKKLLINSINEVANQIDSLPGLTLHINKGAIQQKGRNSIMGFYIDRSYLNSKTGKLVRFVHEEDGDFNDYYTYYFRDDSLVLVTTHRWDKGSGRQVLLSAGRYYYHEGKLLQKQEENYFIMDTKALLNNGRQFIANWKLKQHPAPGLDPAL